jgi:putative FmdB family regulatory protein
MPTYAYRCQNCGSEFDKVQKFSDKPVSKCPACGKGPVRRLLQPAAIVFKGSGWYATDHRSPSGANGSDGKSDKAEKSEPAAKTETPASSSDGDSKPAKKPAKAAASDE